MKRIILATTVLVAAGCNCTRPVRTTQSAPAPTYTAANYSEPSYSYPTERQADFVGPSGPAGPSGARGAQGPTGQTGAEGYAVAGQRGVAGPAGPMGERGHTGSQGPAGDLAVGPTGAAGPTGEMGAQGPMGSTGARGASADGYAGPAGPAGRMGAQGPTGDPGTKGPTLVGPAGREGRSGAAGEQGTTGATGSQGVTTVGVAGAPGVAGPAGPQGPVGPTGQQGPTGVVHFWTSYRDFWFDADKSVVYTSDADKVAGIAAYMRANPSLELGIDGSTNPRATSTRDRDLADRRIKAVRDTLIQAGVPASKISTGTFGDVNLRRDGRVELLIKTDQHSPGQFAQAPSGVVERWTSYQDFWFDADRAEIHPADVSKVSDIAVYMRQNPSLQIGIDSSMNPNVSDQRYLDLAKRRGNAVRDALIAAGVPASNIKSGAFGDSRQWRDRRVEVLVRTDQVARAP